MDNFNAFLYFNPDKKWEFAIFVASLPVCASLEISTPSKILGIGISNFLAKS